MSCLSTKVLLVSYHHTGRTLSSQSKDREFESRKEECREKTVTYTLAFLHNGINYYVKIFITIRLNEQNGRGSAVNRALDGSTYPG